MIPKQLSRRQFFKWGATVTGVLALGEWGGRALTGLAGAAGFIPAFRAHAQTHGELIGVDGKPVDPVMPESAPAPTSTTYHLPAPTTGAPRRSKFTPSVGRFPRILPAQLVPFLERTRLHRSSLLPMPV